MKQASGGTYISRVNYATPPASTPIRAKAARVAVYRNKKWNFRVHMLLQSRRQVQRYREEKFGATRLGAL
jgi:hypothetical protein